MSLLLVIHLDPWGQPATWHGREMGFWLGTPGHQRSRADDGCQRATMQSRSATVAVEQPWVFVGLEVGVDVLQRSVASRQPSLSELTECPRGLRRRSVTCLGVAELVLPFAVGVVRSRYRTSERSSKRHIRA